LTEKPAREEPGVTVVDLRDALKERYLAYALSTITARSLPDVRDGLKPVQRRLLYAMRELGLDPRSGFKKCARVVGDVIGKFHPHGDAPVYDALVRLAQDFAQRYPLVDGQGNFGNVDGDNAAAMRYTESRLTEVAQAMLDGIDEDTVDFRPTYDGSESEPVVLPAAFPNLLANGASGIAVGMATSIPPHHVGELCDALLFLLKREPGTPLPSAEMLTRFVKGPDLPTGGVLVEPEATIAQAYATGRGGLRLRARWQVEQLGYGQYQIVVDQIPYQVPKARLVEQLAGLLAAKKLPLLGDLRDESSDAIRLVLIPRSRGVPPEHLMESLFRQTELETRLSLNLNVLDAQGVPRVMSLAEALQAFLDHRMTVLLRRSRHRIGRINDRLELVDGFLKAFLDLDEVIRIIREEDDPGPVLMRRFELSERQAEAILNLRLRNLRRLEEEALRKERAELVAERAGLQSLLDDEPSRRRALGEEIRKTRDRFAKGAAAQRRTRIAGPPVLDGQVIELPVERLPVTVIVSRNGWLRALRGHAEDLAELRYKEGDAAWLALKGQTTDKLLVFTADGRVYTLPVDKLPGGRGLGEPLSLFIDMGKGVPVVTARLHDPDGRLILATRQGRGFVASEAQLLAQTRTGRQVVVLDEGDVLAEAVPVAGDHVAVLGSNRKLLVFPLAELPEMARGKGVTLQKYKDARLEAVTTLCAEEGITWMSGSRQRHEPVTGFLGRRGSVGRNAPHGFPKDRPFG
jgi:topoisomerase-4 subunit A